MTDDSAPVFAGFWRRFFAFFIDGLILGLPGILLGSLLFDLLSGLQGPTRLIGLGVGVLYFGLLSSSVGGSATLGMRMLGMRVVTTGGRPLDLVRSLWRAFVLQLPISLNGLNLQVDDTRLAIAYGLLAITCVFGVTLAQIILLIFNRPSRRLVHDLLSGSVVVLTGVTSVPKTKSWAPAVAFGVILLAGAGAGFLSFSGPGIWSAWLPRATVENLANMTDTQTAVMALPEVIEVGVQDATNTWADSDGSRTTRTLVITARLKTWPKDEQAEVARIAQAALKAHPLEPGQGMRVVLSQGYDIGIARGSRSSSHPYPAEPAAEPAPPAEPAPAAAPAAPATPA